MDSLFPIAPIFLIVGVAYAAVEVGFAAAFVLDRREQSRLRRERIERRVEEAHSDIAGVSSLAGLGAMTRLRLLLLADEDFWTSPAPAALLAELEERLPDAVRGESDGVGDESFVGNALQSGEIRVTRRIPLDGAYLILRNAGAPGGERQVAICVEQNDVAGEKPGATSVHTEILLLNLETFGRVVEVLEARIQLRARTARESEGVQ